MSEGKKALDKLCEYDEIEWATATGEAPPDMIDVAVAARKIRQYVANLEARAEKAEAERDRLRERLEYIRTIDPQIVSQAEDTQP